MTTTTTKPARVIAFEGVDGAGKSTVLELVAQQLREAGHDVCLPRLGKEHRSAPLRAIRSLTRDRRNVTLSARAELLFYAGREAQVIEEFVRPALARGQTILLDRSMLTPIVLGAYGRGLELDACEQVAAAASAGVQPDLTLVFDVDPRTSHIRKRLHGVRSRAWRDGGRKGLAGSGFKVRVRDGYVAMAARDQLPVVHCERSNPAQVAARVLAIINGEPPNEPPDDAHPWWQVDAGLDFEAGVRELPPLLQLYFTRALPLGRELRASVFESDPELAIWAADLSDPLLQTATESMPDRVLERLLLQPSGAPLRARLLDSHPGLVARSLIGHADEASDRLRLQLTASAPGAVVESLAGRSDAFAAELRQRWWKHADTHERAISLRGLDDDASWTQRARLLEKDPATVIPNLVGLDPARVDPILARHAALAPKPVLRALIGRGDPFSHTLRNDLVETGSEVVDTLFGLDDNNAWRLREQLAERWPSTVVWSLRTLLDHPRTAALMQRCRSAAAGDLFALRRIYQYDRLASGELQDVD